MARRKRGLGRVRMKKMEEIRSLMTEMVGQDFIKDEWSREIVGAATTSFT